LSWLIPDWLVRMLLPLQCVWLTGCKLMHVDPNLATPRAPAFTESPHHSSRRSALALSALAVAVLPPLVMAEAATAADGIAGRNERIVVPILGDLMGLAGPGKMRIRCTRCPHLTVFTVPPTGGSLNRAQAQLGKLAESLGQLEQLTSDLTYATQALN
jgi:hypothetical protein